MKKAFTLIEMLIVVAIIGILATAVLVALGPARNQARDSRIQGDVQQLRNLAEVWSNTKNFDYTGFSCTCNTSDPTTGELCRNIQRLCTDINTQNGNRGQPTIVASQNSACISAVLTSGGVICMDTTGKVGNQACGSSPTCP
jgi:prepilin-type N-terminal cleavage/methylation domain-containing protein